MSCVVLAIGVVFGTITLIQQLKKNKEEEKGMEKKDVNTFMLKDNPENDGEIIPVVCETNDKP